MTVRVHPTGIGEALGDDLIAPGSPLVHTGQVWWVDSATGVDAASPRGLERAYPLATIAQAVSNAAAGDIIILKDGHTEVIDATSQLSISKALMIIGSGQSSGKPTVKLSFLGNPASAPIVVTADNAELHNIWFEALDTATGFAKIYVTGESFRMVGCYAECGDADINVPCVRIAGAYPEVKDSTFVSTATAQATAPYAALAIGADRARVSGCTFDGGTVGWYKGYAIDNTYNNGENGYSIRMEGLTMVRGSDILMEHTSIGHVQVSSGSYAPRIDWDGTVPA